MADQLMGDILRRLRELGDDWHQKLADEMTRTDRTKLREALDRSEGDTPG